MSQSVLEKKLLRQKGDGLREMWNEWNGKRSWPNQRRGNQIIVFLGDQVCSLKYIQV